MRKTSVIIAAALFAFSAPIASFAAMEHDHGSMPMEHGSMKKEHGGGMMSMGKAAHEAVVEGVKASFVVIDNREMMKEMKMKESHHIMVMFTEPKSGKQLSEGEVTVKVLAPDKKEEVKALMEMERGFGADFTMRKPGKYGVMAKFQLKDGKVRSTKFWYTVK